MYIKNVSETVTLVINNDEFLIDYRVFNKLVSFVKKHKIKKS